MYGQHGLPLTTIARKPASPRCYTDKYGSLSDDFPRLGHVRMGLQGVLNYPIEALGISTTGVRGTPYSGVLGCIWY